MKKYIALLLALLLLVGVTACGDDSVEKDTKKTTTVTDKPASTTTTTDGTEDDGTTTTEGDVTTTEGASTTVTDGEKITFGNADRAIAYEYTYTYRGAEYHTYQVMVVHEKIPLILQKGYVFTFTAPEAAYAEQIESVKKMIGKVNF